MIHMMGLPNLARFQEMTDLDSLSGLILAEREKRLNLTRELMLEKQKIRQLEDFIEEIFVNGEDLEDNNTNEKGEEDEIRIGAYPKYIRKLKIRNYKLKIKKYRQKVKISRKFKGRSIAAKKKPRFNGKFARKQIINDD